MFDYDPIVETISVLFFINTGQKHFLCVQILAFGTYTDSF